MFESQMIQFEQKPEEEKRSTHGRRSGIKKVDDEHLIMLAKRQEEITRNKKERDERIHRTSFIRQMFEKLKEDGKETKEELKDQIELARERQRERELSKSTGLAGLFKRKS